MSFLGFLSLYSWNQTKLCYFFFLPCFWSIISILSFWVLKYDNLRLLALFLWSHTQLWSNKQTNLESTIRDSFLRVFCQIFSFLSSYEELRWHFRGGKLWKGVDGVVSWYTIHRENQYTISQAMQYDYLLNYFRTILQIPSKIDSQSAAVLYKQVIRRYLLNRPARKANNNKTYP